MNRKDLVKKILELSLKLKDAEGVQAMMYITDMEKAVKNYEKQFLIAYRTMLDFDIQHESIEDSVDYFLKNKESYL